MICCWCRRDPGTTLRRDAQFCSRKCRQAAWRARSYSKATNGNSVDVRPLRFAYADPPYPGTARRYYKGEDSFQGEVDHPSLIDRLTTGGFDGLALSTSARALRELLPLCPAEIRVCAWSKPGGAPPATRGLHNVWEPLLVLQGRRIQPGRRDALYVHPARFGGTLTGRKPLKFCAWLFDAMGMLPGDELVDLFPGTGIVARAWAEISGRHVAQDLEAAATSTGLFRFNVPGCSRDQR